MGDHGRLAGPDALDEMARSVAAMLTALGDLPDEAETTRVCRVTVPEWTAEVPDLTELDTQTTDAVATWVDWQRRLTELRTRQLQH